MGCILDIYLVQLTIDTVYKSQTWVIRFLSNKTAFFYEMPIKRAHVCLFFYQHFDSKSS